MFEGFKSLVEKVNLIIPSYTTYLESLKDLADFRKETVMYSLEIDPNADLEDLNEQGRFIELNALVTISLLDLYIVSKNLCLVDTDWERIFYIKNGYLVIHETIVAYNKHRTELRSITNHKYKNFKENFESINIDLKHFKEANDYDGTIAHIRNKVSGHIDSNFELYFNIIKELDGEKLCLIILQFIQILSRLLELLNDISLVQNLNLSAHLLNLKKEAEQSNKLVLGKLKELESLFYDSTSGSRTLSELTHPLS